MHRRRSGVTEGSKEEVALAMEIAKKAHANQVRKFNLEPYVNHPIRVSNSVEGDREKAVALLHDVPEDTSVTHKDLIAAGISEETVDLVKVLTREWHERYEDYITRIINEKNDVVLIVKWFDIKDNMRDLPKGHPLIHRYRAARSRIKKAINNRYGELR